MDSENNPTPPAERVTQSSPPAAEADSTGSSATVNGAPAGRHAPETTPVGEAANTAPPEKRTPPATAAGREVPASTEVPSGTTPAARVVPATGATKTASTPTPAVNRGVTKAVAAKQPGAVVETSPESKVNKIRRRIVWASITGFLATSFLMFLRFFLPRSIFEPSNVFRVGTPSEYGIGVDTKWQQQYRIWVVKTADKLFVINAVCTHLGCTPDWKQSENKFKCPCHGSGYDSEGVAFEGPAPRPMDRAHVELDAEGQIVVNKDKLYTWPKGEPSQFDEENSYIPL